MSSSDGNSDERKNDGPWRKLTSAERDLYVKPLLRLKQQEEILERGLVTTMESMKINPNLLQGIVREHKELSLKRENFLSVLRENLSGINSELECVRNIAKNPEEIKKLDINSYRQKLMKLSQKMQDFEKSCPLQALMEEGAALNSELRELEPDLKKYEKMQKDAVLSSHSWQKKIENKKINVECKDVDDFHALVAVTGHTENWDMKDHLLFLKTREKCESVPVLVAAIQKKCPDLSTEAIVNHEAWYKHYQNLRERQKDAIEKWRQEKEEIRRKHLCEESCSEIENYKSPVDRLEKIEEVEEINVRKSRKISKPEVQSVSSSASSSNSEKKELIRKWRMEKENKRCMDEEQIKLQAKLKREMEENRRRKRREKIQEALDEYRGKKNVESTLREQDERLKEKYRYNTSLIKAFRKQDEEFTKKRKDLILRSKRPSKSDLLELKKVELVENRDYSTLMDPTKVWSEKCKIEYSTRNSSDSQYIKDIPRTCVRWRNEESEDLRI